MTARMRVIGRRSIVGVAAVLLFLSVTVGPLTQVAEAACASPSIAFGRWRWCGYWLNRFDDDGDSVRQGGVPSSVNTAEEFISLINSDLASGNANRITGASFVIHTMIGSPLPNPAQGYSSPTTPRPPTAAQRTEWAKRVRSYANYSTSGNTQYGTNGRIEWWARQHLTCGTYNTYWQATGGGGNYNDIAPYVMNSGNSNCEVSSFMDDVIVFRDEAGNEVYKIRRNCMNPLGTLESLDDRDPVDFTLDPGVGMEVRDGASGPIISGDVAEVGDRVTFSYTVRNTGPTVSTTANCSVTGRSYAGYQSVPSDGPLGGSGVGVSTGCPRTFPVATTTVATEVIDLTGVHANQTICRQLEVSPASATNSVAVREVRCVKVVNKPYTKITNGDVSVGNGFATVAAPGSCTPINTAGVIGWNRGSASSYQGAGTRHAVYALGLILEHASAHDTAREPYGLSFSNASTNDGQGWYGGDFGTSSCIPDYFEARPAANQSWKTNVSAMSDSNGGIYYSDGSAILEGGNVNNNSRVSVYVNGDLHITSNIIYANNFNANSMPLFHVVVKGNIYIESDVTRLDGIYVAQPTGTAEGIIYTCALNAATNPYTAPVPTAGNFYTACNNPLTVNGAFTARQIELMRTHGSLKSASDVAETFNYSPAFWMQQPRGGSGGSTYDSITSLPPIL